AHRTSENAAAEIKELNNRLLQQLAQKERLAALGQASAEFVHDLGNPLTIVWGYVQLLARRLKKSEEDESASSVKELKIIEQHVRTCRELLTMWQGYGNVEASPPRPVSVSATLQEILKGLAPVADQKGIAFRVTICDDRCVLLGDAFSLIAPFKTSSSMPSRLARKKRELSQSGAPKKIFTSIFASKTTGPGSRRLS